MRQIELRGKLANTCVITITGWLINSDYIDESY